MSGETELERMVAEEEARLVLPAFDETVAFEIGRRLVERARAERAPVVIDIRTPDRTLFHAALPGATPANDLWAKRKSNTVFHFHRSSHAVGLAHKRSGFGIGPGRGLDPMDYSDHGGSFPLRVKGAGLVAAVTVSGLASEDDHAMIVAVLDAMLGERAGQGG